MTPCRKTADTFDQDRMIPITEAAEISGDSLRRWQRLAAAEAALATKECRSPLALLFPTAPGRKAEWHVSRLIDKRLRQTPGRESSEGRERAGLLEKHPAHSVALAYRRHFWLTKWRERCNQRRSLGTSERSLAEDIVREARHLEGPGFKISTRSLMRWWKEYQRIGKGGKRLGTEGLIDRYGSGRSNGDTRSPEAIEYFHSVYRTQSKLTIKQSHRVTCRESRTRGWHWPSSYQAATKWFHEHDDRPITFLMREGKDKWCHRYLPHLEMDWSAVDPGHAYVADHAQCDFWVRYKDRVLRPWLTAIQDRRGRCIVGWHLGPSPHQDAVMSALRSAFRDWSIPEIFHIDNGKDFTSKLIVGMTKAECRAWRKVHGREWKDVLRRDRDLIKCDDARWYGITGELGIEVVFAKPFSPWSKGTLERWFGRFHQDCAKAEFVTYCANSPGNRPECLKEILKSGDVGTLDEAGEIVGAYIERYHLEEHRGVGVDGSTPLAVWNTAATTLRRALENELAFLMDVRGVYKVSANGVRFKVGGASIAYGATSPALRKHVGRQVLIALDTNDLSTCWAYTPERDKRRLIGRLEANERIVPYTHTDDAREAIARISRAQSVKDKAQRSAADRTRTAAQVMSKEARMRRRELAATGTDDKRGDPVNVTVVRTGFEGVSMPVRSDVETAQDSVSKRDGPSARETAQAIFGRKLAGPKQRNRRVMDELFRRDKQTTSPSQDWDGSQHRTEAGPSSTDLLRMIGKETRRDDGTNK